MGSRAVVLGCPVDRLDMRQTVDRCARLIEARRPSLHVSVNAAKLVAMRDDAQLRAIVANADVISADGQAVVWASRLSGDRLPERVAGIDLMHALLARAATSGWSVYLLGATDEVLERAAERLREQHPGLHLAGTQHGYFAETEGDRIREQIRAARPDILFVAMSSPKKEYWMAENLSAVDVPLVMGVGGALDVAAGLTRRAPLALQRAGLEWAFRLAQEPRRLVRRYAVTNARFLGLLSRELLAGEGRRR